MRKFDFKEFYNSIQKDFLEASEFITYIERYKYIFLYQTDDEEDDEELELNKIRLVDKLESIKLKFDFAYEFLNLNKLSDQLNEELKSYSGKFDELKIIPFVADFYSPVLWILSKHLGALTSHTKIDNENEYATINLFSLLEQILRGTPKMLTDRNIEPSNETEVKKEVYNTLIHVFPSTVKEIPIPKISKVYKPDIGIKSLKTAIEYKFVDSEQEIKTAIGGIFEDTKGYEGSNDWTNFYAVIYMTDNFMTQPQIEAEFKLSKIPHHWKPILVYGKGKRNKKKNGI
jgi:hypothetical protein